MTSPRTEPPGTAEPAPPAAAIVFGDQLPQARQYAGLLAREGVLRGLIGPREVPRLWPRHVLNSAVLTDLVPIGERVVDVGSGAGLPGIPMALRRPDLAVDLVEPMLRRTTFLAEAVEALAISDRVRVVRGRAEDRAVRDATGDARWVVARAVAPLDRLVGWCFRLLAPGGTLLALKGASAEQELTEHRATLRAHGAGEVTMQRLGDVLGLEATWVISVRRREAS